MKLLNIRPVAHAVHSMNNDYQAYVPHRLQMLAIVGMVVIIVAALLIVMAPSAWSLAGLAAGIAILLPAGITSLITRYALKRRFRVRDGIVHHAELRGHEQVLDIGTGSSIMLFGCAKQLTTGKGTGIDIYAHNSGGGTPEIFWKNAAREGVQERVDLKQMDARKMTFANASFDVVVSSFAFHHIGHRDAQRQAAHEILRVLKPGGRVLVYDAGFALDELEQVMREAGCSVQRFGDQFSMLIGQKAA